MSNELREAAKKKDRSYFIEAAKQQCNVSDGETLHSRPIKYLIEGLLLAIEAIQSETVKPEPVDYDTLRSLGWQSIECPICESSSAMAYPPMRESLKDEGRNKIIEETLKIYEEGFENNWVVQDVIDTIRDMKR